MLGEKRNLSLFGSQPAQEEKQVKHITVDRDGEKKDIPLYFGPDWPVVNGTGDTVPSPSDDPSACQAEATAEKTEETIPVEPIPQDTPAGIADNSPDSDVRYPDDYGEDIEISPYDDTHFTVIIEVNPSGTFYGWVFKFMGKIRILSPQSCVDKMQDIARTFI